MNRRKMVIFSGILLAAFICTAEAEEQKTFSDFTADVSEGLQKRKEIAGEALDGFQESASEESVRNAYDRIAEAEWTLIEDYEGVLLQIDDILETEQMNREYIVQTYVAGVRQQAEALEYSRGDSELFWEQWEEGYKKRACALVEMKELYAGTYETVDFIPEEIIREMKDLVVGEPCAQGEDPCYIVQALAGCNIDGQIGYGTRSAIKKFQKRNGLIMNGIINENMIRDMIKELSPQKKKGVLDTAAERLKEHGMQEILDEYYNDHVYAEKVSDPKMSISETLRE